MCECMQETSSGIVMSASAQCWNELKSAQICARNAAMEGCDIPGDDYIDKGISNPVLSCGRLSPPTICYVYVLYVYLNMYWFYYGYCFKQKNNVLYLAFS